MSIFRRGRIYWYKFMWNGEMIRESTKQGNRNIARQIEAAHRASLAKGEVGIREKQVAPPLCEFCQKRLEPWAKATFETNTPNNWLWYRAGMRSLLSYKPLANAKLDTIGNELAAEFASYRLNAGRAVSTANSSLRVCAAP
jgi:hypothetical protein